MEDPAEFFQDSPLHSFLKFGSTTSLSSLSVTFFTFCHFHFSFFELLAHYLVTLPFYICTLPDEEAMASKACGNKDENRKKNVIDVQSNRKRYQ